MARGLNKVMLIGNVGDEPTIRNTSNGTMVATVRMVTNEFRRDQDGNGTEFAEWHRVVLWDNLARVARDYLHRGTQIYIEGKLRTSSYEDQRYKDQNGNPLKRYTTEVVASDMQMLGTRASNGAAPAGGEQPYEGGQRRSSRRDGGGDSFGSNNSYGNNSFSNGGGAGGAGASPYGGANGYGAASGFSPDPGAGFNSNPAPRQAPGSFGASPAPAAGGFRDAARPAPAPAATPYAQPQPQGGAEPAGTTSFQDDDIPF